MAPLYGPAVWTGRALQAESDDLEVIGLALLYPARTERLFLANMDIRARSTSFASRPRRPYGRPRCRTSNNFDEISPAHAIPKAKDAAICSLKHSRSVDGSKDIGPG